MRQTHKILDLCAQMAHTSLMNGSWKRYVPAMRGRTIIAVTVLCYVAFHALHGAQGFNGFLTEEHKQTTLQEQIRVTHDQRMRLEHRVDLLTGKEIDEDLLEELAKRQLMMLKSNEIMMVP